MLCKYFLIASVLYDGTVTVATASSQATGSVTNTDQESIKSRRKHKADRTELLDARVVLNCLSSS